MSDDAATSETGRALAAGVRAHPDDWSHWLVFADWLTEHGDARGELIVLGHRLETATSHQDELELRARIDERVQANEREWLRGWEKPEGAELLWRHGFVLEVMLRWSDRTLADLDRLVAHPTARLLATLDLSYTRMGDAGARALATSAALQHFAELFLEGNEIGVAGARALAASTALRNLTRLDLRGNEIGGPGARALAASETLRGCRILT